MQGSIAEETENDSCFHRLGQASANDARLHAVNLLRALSTVSGMTLLSRITGLARESLKAAAFGAGVQMDAFEAAFRLPNILRRLFAEGAFAQAFVPIFAEYRRQRGDDETRDLGGARRLASGTGAAGLTDAGVAAAPALVYLLAAGFAQTPGKVALTADMIRIVFPYILFMSLVSLSGGMLNVYRRFAIPAFTPVLLNLSIIGAALVPRALLRPADHGVGLGRVHRRQSPSLHCRFGRYGNRHAAAAALRLARSGRAAGTARNGPGGGGCVRCADLGADQYATGRRCWATAAFRGSPTPTA